MYSPYGEPKNQAKHDSCPQLFSPERETKVEQILAAC